MLVLKEKQYYVRRDGEIVGPMFRNSVEEFPFIDRKTMTMYTENGCFSVGGHESRFDLVRPCLAGIEPVVGTTDAPLWG